MKERLEWQGRSAGQALASLAGKLADAELRAQEAERKVAELEAEKQVARSVVVTFVERGFRKDALEIVARTLGFNEEERRRVGLDGGGGPRRLGTFLDTLSEFVRDETS